MRLLETLTFENRSAKVYRDVAWDEYRVKFYENGAYCTESDYFTTDKVDAFGTAELWAGPAIRCELKS